MEKAFNENLDIKVSSAQIGISKANWDYAEEEWTLAQAREFMENHSYDVLPIKGKNGNFTFYWSTKINGDYSEINKIKIDTNNTIYYLTELSDLLVKFQESSNSSYFLTNHSTINGLVSNVNLNSKPVYVYFYSLISKVEIELGHWLKALVPEKEMLLCIIEKSKNLNDELSMETIKRYNLDQMKNVHNHFVEYLYFSQYQYIIKKMKLTSTFGYDSNTKFVNDFKIISNYRNWFAHPLNSSKVNLSKDLLSLHIALDRLSENLESGSIDLIKAYHQTTYTTLEVPKLEIKIGRFNSMLNDYLKENEIKYWAFITAENPNSTKLSNEENAERNALLEKRLIKVNYRLVRGIGIPNDDKWDTENSYLVFNLSKSKAKELCTLFNQNAFVFGEIDQIPELVRIIESGNT